MVAPRYRERGLEESFVCWCVLVWGARAGARGRVWGGPPAHAAFSPLHTHKTFRSCVPKDLGRAWVFSFFHPDGIVLDAMGGTFVAGPLGASIASIDQGGGV
jgi:hypothetical protein